MHLFSFQELDTRNWVVSYMFAPAFNPVFMYTVSGQICIKTRFWTPNLNLYQSLGGRCRFFFTCFFPLVIQGWVLCFLNCQYLPWLSDRFLVRASVLMPRYTTIVHPISVWICTISLHDLLSWVWWNHQDEKKGAITCPPISPSLSMSVFFSCSRCLKLTHDAG